MTDDKQVSQQHAQLEEKSLLFIPDISGFTRFVNETEIDHSQHIIKELLEIIIDANQLDLSVSEIEGDAVLFYKMNQVPDVLDLAQQAREMFIRFHQHLKLYERDRICECGACATAHQLTMKVFAHSGNLRHLQVKDHAKLMGTDVILAHRLMKNSIDSDAYLLVTEQCFGDRGIATEPVDWMEWQEGSDAYSEIGEVTYRYASLSPLLHHLGELPPRPNYEKMANPIRYEFRVDAPLKVVHKVLADIDIKPKISDGIVGVAYDRDKVPRVGTLHQCILPDGYLDIRATDNQIMDNERIYAERIENFPIFKKANVLYTMKESDGQTSLQVDLHYAGKGPVNRIKSLVLRPLLRSKFKQGILQAIAYAEKVQQGKASLEP